MSTKDSPSQASAFTSYPADEPKGFGKKRGSRKKGAKAETPNPTAQTHALPYDFDSAVYLEINTDVADAGIEASVHYVYQGITEGRAYKWPEGMPDDEESKAKARKGEF